MIFLIIWVSAGIIGATLTMCTLWWTGEDILSLDIIYFICMIVPGVVSFAVGVSLIGKDIIVPKLKYQRQLRNSIKNSKPKKTPKVLIKGRKNE